jgi:Brp/Blh family beta-carotene 15,15'-monooxygenase
MELYFYLSFTSFFIISLFYKNLRKFLWIEIILIVFLGYFFSKAPLLLSFSVYFVFWHSIPSILDQLKFLYKEDNSSKIKYLISSLPYWIMSVLGLFGFYFYFHTKPETFLPLFFSFLAAITFPHTIVMGWIKIYKPKTKE